MSNLSLFDSLVAFPSLYQTRTAGSVSLMEVCGAFQKPILRKLRSKTRSWYLWGVMLTVSCRPCCDMVFISHGRDNILAEEYHTFHSPYYGTEGCIKCQDSSAAWFLYRDGKGRNKYALFCAVDVSAPLLFFCCFFLCRPCFCDGKTGLSDQDHRAKAQRRVIKKPNGSVKEPFLVVNGVYPFGGGGESRMLHLHGNSEFETNSRPLRTYSVFARPVWMQKLSRQLFVVFPTHRTNECYRRTSICCLDW